MPNVPMHSFTFNGLNSREYCSLFVSNGATHSAPERDIESVSIPGRNGELTIDHGRFKNIKLSYSGWIIEDVDENVVKARNWLSFASGYKKLIDCYHNDLLGNPIEYRMARLTGGVEFQLTNTYPVAAVTSLNFDCMPQRFLINGDNPIEITESGTQIASPTFYQAVPLIKVDGTGSGKISVKAFNEDSSVRFECEVKISDIGGTTYLDSDIERAYQIQNGIIVPVDNRITLSNGYPRMNFDTISENDDPVITERRTFIYFYDGVTKVTITPRWWRI